jgi:two-component system, chemotaxis family, CheB/CheR fusion protein
MPEMSQGLGAGGDARPRIVGLGASAGGLDALELLAGQLDSQALCCVVLQHLSPDHASLLPELLARRTRMRVLTIEDGARCEAGCIYVAPPNVGVLLERGVLRLAPPGEERPRRSIDAFFRSLADSEGARGVGVVLSGTGSDGAQGLCAIRSAGGRTFAQDPRTASQAEMPESALETGCADASLAPAAIGEALMALASESAGGPPAAVAPADALETAALFKALHDAVGVDFSGYKPSTIERRIHRRMALRGDPDLHTYALYACAHPEELKALYGDLLIGVTAFFRDGYPFETLTTEVFPQLLQRKAKDAAIRVWVAGCATGEEAYSIAMLISEALSERAGDFTVKVFASDVDEDALATARVGRYPRSIAGAVSPERLERFFVHSDEGYRVRRSLRDLVVFARHNLGRDPPFSQLDLVCCRNALIYMRPHLQAKVIAGFHYALTPGGYLLLGASETVGDAADVFSLVNQTSRLYQKRAASPSAQHFMASLDATIAPVRQRAAALRPSLTLLQLADRRVLDLYGPAGVVVDAQLEIVQYLGRPGVYFDPPAGAASNHVLRQVRSELAPELKRLLARARTDSARVLATDLQPFRGEPERRLTLDVSPLADPSLAGVYFVVLFAEQRHRHEQPPRDAAAPGSAGPAARFDEPGADGLLRDAWTYVQATVEDFELAEAQLRSANEQLQSANEELQSANEELETSREELQSTNEELVTMNEQLHAGITRLQVTQDSLRWVLDAARSALVVIARDLTVRAFSRAAARLLGLAPGDAGRPMAALSAAFQGQALEQAVAATLARTRRAGLKIRRHDGPGLTVWLTPCVGDDGAVSGVVLELSRPKRDSAAAPLPARRSLGAGVPEALGVLDASLRLTWGNAAFLALFQLDASALGRPFAELWAGAEAEPDLWAQLAQAVEQGEAFDHATTVAPAPHAPRADLTFSAHRLTRSDDGPAPVLLNVRVARRPGPRTGVPHELPEPQSDRAAPRPRGE